MSACYRLWQFVQAVRGHNKPPDLGTFATLLTAKQAHLFASMSSVDQHHCLAVAQALAAQGVQQPDLLRAALIHDVGKSLGRIRLWERVVHVLLLRCAPALVGRVGSVQAGGFGHGLYLLAHHAHLGAQLAAEAGFSEATVRFVRGTGDADLQEALRRADDSH